jgi:hypothetical protein
VDEWWTPGSDRDPRRLQPEDVEGAFIFAVELAKEQSVRTARKNTRNIVSSPRGRESLAGGSSAKDLPNGLSEREKAGGDDGTQTRDLMRDRLT